MSSRRHLTKLAVSLLLGGGFFWMMQRGGLPLLPSSAALARVRWWVVALYVLMLVVINGLRAHRWVYLLRPLTSLPLRRILGVNFIGYAAILLAPLRMGELVRPYLIAEDKRVTFAQAMGTVGAERVIDGLFLACLLFVSLQLSHPLSPLPDHLGALPLPVATIPKAAYMALVLFGCAFAFMALFYWRRALAHRLTLRVVGVVSERFAETLATQVERIADGLRFLPSKANLFPFVSETAAYWIANVLGMWFLLWGCDIEASFTQACVVMGVLGMGVLVPAGPGFFGSFQLSVYCALALFIPIDIVIGAGSSYVFLLYTTQGVVILLLGLLGFALDPAAETSHLLEDAQTAASLDATRVSGADKAI